MSSPDPHRCRPDVAGTNPGRELPCFFPSLLYISVAIRRGELDHDNTEEKCKSNRFWNDNCEKSVSLFPLHCQILEFVHKRKIVSIGEVAVSINQQNPANVRTRIAKAQYKTNERFLDEELIYRDLTVIAAKGGTWSFSSDIDLVAYPNLPNQLSSRK